MLILIISLIILGIFAAIIGYFSNRKGEVDDIIQPKGDCSSCNGTNTKCEQECVMEASTKEIEYFNDEELDVYKGRKADSYTDEEVEDFSEVLYTLKSEEVKDWNRSILLRGIELPNQLKDELIMMIEG
nr:hypothetical protein [Prevotella sp.]